MDANTNASFYNNGGGQMITCPSCNALNEPDSMFCGSCGTKLIQPKAPEPVAAAPAFQPAEPAPAPAFQPAEPASAPAFQPAEPAAAPAFRPAESEPAPAFQPAEPAPAPAFQPAEPAPAPAFQVADSAPAFAPARDLPPAPAAEAPTPLQQVPVDNTPAFQMTAPEPEPEPEEQSAFAKGLPAWDMVPPEVVVRRKKKI